MLFWLKTIEQFSPIFEIPFSMPIFYVKKKQNTKKSIISFSIYFVELKYDWIWICPSRYSFFLFFHKLGLFEDSPYETCGNEYFKLCTWKNEENDEQSVISIFYYS